MLEIIFEVNTYVTVSVPLAQDITNSIHGSFVD